MIETAIFTILKDHSGVSGIVDERIYPMVLPQECVYPAISHEVDTFGGDITYDGQGTFDELTVTVHCWSDTHLGMRNLRDQVLLALKNYEGIVEGVHIDKVYVDSTDQVFESEVEKYREAIVFSVFIR